MEPRRRFRVLRELAAGGFGKVYLAEMVTGDNFSSVVAIKILQGKWLGNDEIVMRSRDEARLLGRLRHRHIVRVEDLTTIHGQCAIVMEYLRGADLKTLAALLLEQRRGFPRRAAFEVLGAVADALDAAYNARPIQGGEPLHVVHRDIKPSNVMLTVEGDVKVLDFGTARSSFEDREAKTQALAFGSAAYMAPERHLGEDDAPAGDVFSLGVTAYELLTLEGYGKIQVKPEKYAAQLDERMAAMDLGGLDPGLRVDLVDLLRRMLAYEPTVRPTAAEVREGMEQLAEAARDMPLRRFARDTVAAVADAPAAPSDPQDHLVGAEVHEDAGGVAGNETASRARTWDEEPRSEPVVPAKPAYRPPPAPLGISTIRPADAPPGLPPGLGQGLTARPRPTGEQRAEPRPPARPPENRLGAAPTIVGDPDPAANGAAVAGAVEPTLPTPPPPIAPRGSSEPRPRALPHADSGATLKQSPLDEDLPPAPGAGLIVKLGLAAVALGALLSLVAVVAWFVFAGSPDRPTPEVETPPVPAEAVGAEPPRGDLVEGAAAPDWAPNTAGRGGVILSIPGASVSEVSITAATTRYRLEWSGKGYLRLKDLDPGVYRAKVKPTGGGPAAWTDFSVEAGKTCLLTYASANQDGAWNPGDCR